MFWNSKITKNSLMFEKISSSNFVGYFSNFAKKGIERIQKNKT